MLPSCRSKECTRGSERRRRVNDRLLRMPILFEIRYPSRWYTKLLVLVLGLLFFTLLATGSIAAFLTYRIIKPQRTSSEISRESFPGRPDSVDFTVPGGGLRHGWFFPGRVGAPTVVLCHGYESSRGELLTLISELQDHQYNVFAFDFAGHGAIGGISTLGYEEAAEVRAAIDTLAQRIDVDPARFGLWGYNLGAYAALSEAEKDPRVRTIILDSVYDDPAQLVMVEVKKAGLGRFQFLIHWTQHGFRWINHQYRDVPPLSKSLGQLAGVPKLFIEAIDQPDLAEATREIFLEAPRPREEAVLGRGNFVSMDDDDKRLYENRVVSFFLLHLPAAGKPRK